MHIINQGENDIICRVLRNNASLVYGLRPALLQARSAVKGDAGEDSGIVGINAVRFPVNQTCHCGFSSLLAPP